MKKSKWIDTEPGCIYLMRDSSEGVCHCTCEQGYASYPAQMECSWCGCGWLFTCIICRKAFTFARAFEFDEPLEHFAKWDIKQRTGKTASPKRIHEWLSFMESFLAEARADEQFVYLDGLLLPTRLRKFRGVGLSANHDLAYLPQVQALKVPKILDQTIGSPEYWKERVLSDNDLEEN